MIQSSDVMGAAAGYSGHVGGPPHGVVRRSARPRRDPTRLRRRVLVAGAAVAVLAFAGGAFAGALHVSTSQQTIERFAKEWSAGDYAAMYSELSPPERARVRRGAFTRAYQRAVDTAT